MDSNYIVVFNERKKGEIAASQLCAAIDKGALIIAATATRDSVHYLVASAPEAQEMALNEETRQIIRDNLDAEEAAEKNEDE